MRSLEDTLLLIPGFLVGFAMHEFAHALAADKLGDPTPRQQGRLTIEPWPHIDIFGFITLILVGFGWAKPVQVNPANFKNPRRDDIIVSLAGPLTNIALAVLFALSIVVLRQLNILENAQYEIRHYTELILGNAVWINILLAVFNLLPIPPLDGSHVVANLLPYEWAYRYMSLQVYSIFIFIALMLTRAYVYVIFLPTAILFTIIMSSFGLSDIVKAILWL